MSGVVAQRVRPHSKPSALRKVDQRTREAAHLRRVKAELREHVGGKPSITQSMLIDRCAMLSLRVHQLDAAMAAGEAISDFAARSYLAWSNSLVRTLRELGVKPSTKTNGPTDLEAYLASRSAANGAGK
jgi:hypothetical protein